MRPTQPFSSAQTGVPHRAEPAGLVELTRSLLRRRLADLERRLIDMAETIDTRLHRGDGPGAAEGAGPMIEVACLRPDAAVLAEVRAALARFETGRYGHCTECGSPVELERLVERPQTRYCEDCEHEQAHGGCTPYS